MMDEGRKRRAEGGKGRRCFPPKRRRRRRKRQKPRRGSFVIGSQPARRRKARADDAGTRVHVKALIPRETKKHLSVHERGCSIAVDGYRPHNSTDEPVQSSCCCCCCTEGKKKRNSGKKENHSYLRIFRIIIIINRSSNFICSRVGKSFIEFRACFPPRDRLFNRSSESRLLFRRDGTILGRGNERDTRSIRRSHGSSSIFR